MWRKLLLGEPSLWDLLMSLIFATCLSAFVQIGADSGEKNVDHIVLAVFLGLFSYLLAYVIALLLPNSMPMAGTWWWLAIFGALIHTALRGLRIYGDFTLYDDSLMSPGKYFLSKVLPWFILNWLAWAVLGIVFIYVCRVVAVSLARRFP